MGIAFFLVLLLSHGSQKNIKIISGSAEYRAMANTCLEIIWLRYHLKVPCNLSAQLFHERTKHIEIDCHIVREKLQTGIISLSYVPTQLADIFTKALGKKRFLTLRIIRYCTKLYAINLIMIESHD